MSIATTVYGARTCDPPSMTCFPSPGFPVYCFTLAAAPAAVSVTVENSMREFAGPMGTSVGFTLAGVSATLDQALISKWGCASGTTAAVALSSRETIFSATFL